MSSAPQALLVGGARTPVGRYGGALPSVRPDGLAALVVEHAVTDAGIDPHDVDEVVPGNANGVGEENRNVARMAWLLAGFPDTVPGITINRLRASSLSAIIMASHMIMAGAADVVVAGGVKSVSRTPWVMAKPATGFAKPGEVFDTSIGWRFTDPESKKHDKTTCSMPETAEEVAVVDTDEGPRPGTTMDVLAKLRPVVSHGSVVTAGNSSSLNDGASAILGPDAFFPVTVLSFDDPETPEAHFVEAFGPVTSVLGCSDVDDAVRLAALGGGSLVATVCTNDGATAARFTAGIGSHHGRVHFLNRQDVRTSTGHGSPMPHLVHGGPGRAGGCEELGGVRGVLHYMQRTAIQAPRTSSPP